MYVTLSSFIRKSRKYIEKVNNEVNFKFSKFLLATLSKASNMEDDEFSDGSFINEKKKWDR